MFSDAAATKNGKHVNYFNWPVLLTTNNKILTVHLSSDPFKVMEKRVSKDSLSLTVSMVLKPIRALPDGASPLLRLVEVGSRVLERGETEALFHSLPREPRAYPTPLKRVEIGGQVSRRVRVIIFPVRPASDAVLQAEDHSVPARRYRGEPLDDELPVSQAHGAPDLLVTSGREFPVQSVHVVTMFGSLQVHPDLDAAVRTQWWPHGHIAPRPGNTPGHRTAATGPTTVNPVE